MSPSSPVDSLKRGSNGPGSARTVLPRSSTLPKRNWSQRHLGARGQAGKAVEVATGDPRGGIGWKLRDDGAQHAISPVGLGGLVERVQPVGWSTFVVVNEGQPVAVGQGHGHVAGEADVAL